MGVFSKLLVGDWNPVATVIAAIAAVGLGFFLRIRSESSNFVEINQPGHPQFI